jgi:hypothetical protein
MGGERRIRSASALLSESLLAELFRAGDRFA